MNLMSENERTVFLALYNARGWVNFAELREKSRLPAAPIEAALEGLLWRGLIETEHNSGRKLWRTRHG